MKIVMTKPVAVAAAAKKTVAGKSSIWGGIILLPSKTEVDWDGQSFEKGMEPLAEMKGTKYGTDWKWAGDLPPEECDIAIRLKNGRAYDFGGPTALQDLFNLARKSGAVKATKAAENTEEEDALEAAVLTELFKITPAFTQEEIESSHDNGRRISNARKLLLTKCYEKLLSPYPGLQERMDNIARLEAAQLMALGIMKPGKVSGVNMDIKEIRALYTKNKPLADRLAKKLADETYPGPAPRRAKATKAAEPGKLPKTLQLLKTLNASQFGAEWDKEADTVRVWATGTQRPMQFRIIGQLDKAIKEDTGAKSVLVLSGTSYKPNSLALNGKLNSKIA